MDYIRKNIDEIRKRIDNSLAKSNRQPNDVLLLAVTKTVDIERIRTSLDCGITDIGENKVQELLSKYDSLNTNWHLIGHLQKNKVKYIIDKVKLIHSVDSLELAKEINRRASNLGIVKDILVEINVSGELTKFGLDFDKAKELIRSMQQLDSIAIKGLMTVAPFVENGETNRTIFKKMYQLFVDINQTSVHNKAMEFLSMGMSGDFEVAIEEGSNIVRIGTGIFGTR